MQNCVHYSCLVGQFLSDLRNCALSCFITQMNLNAVKLLFFKCPAFYKRFRWGGWMLSMWKKYKWRRRKRSDLWLIDFLAGSESYRKCSSCYDILLSLVLPALVLFCGFNFIFFMSGSAILAMKYYYHWYCQHCFCFVVEFLFFFLSGSAILAVI